jgi:hypothetical protein
MTRCAPGKTPPHCRGGMPHHFEVGGRIELPMSWSISILPKSAMPKVEPTEDP